MTLNKKEETSRDRRLSRDEENRLLDTALQKMNTSEHQFAGPPLHDRIIGALELCCRRGEMLLIQNRRVYSDTNQIGIPGATAKDRENRRVPFDPEGRLAAILTRREKLGPLAYVFGTANGEYQTNIQTAWETLKLLAYGFEPRRGAEGEAWNRERLREIDLRWHDLRHEGARSRVIGRSSRRLRLLFACWSIQGETPIRTELCRLAIGLGNSLIDLFPREPEVAGLLALMMFHDARRDARFNAHGAPIPLPEQDRTRWDRAAIGSATALLDRALSAKRPGPFQIEAAMSAVHCGAAAADMTDWREIADLYALLETCRPTPAVRVNSAFAVGRADERRRVWRFWSREALPMSAATRMCTWSAAPCSRKPAVTRRRVKH